MVDCFSEIVGHAAAKRGLLRAASTGRVHHALLFSGRRGIGKLALARAFAQVLLCEESQLGVGLGGLRRCGVCRHCRRIEKDGHPDFLILRPSGVYISIAQIRQLQQDVSCNPFEARLRVVIIDDAHAMQDAAGNAILKTLEEPGSQTQFLLLTDQAHGLLPTVRSRCQVVRLAPFSWQEVCAQLVAQGRPEDLAQRVAAVAMGSPGEASSWSDSGALGEVYGFLDAMETLEDPAQAIDLAKEISGQGELVPVFLRLLSTYLRDLAVVGACGSGAEVIHVSRREGLLERAGRVDVDTIIAAFECVEQVRRALRGNVNQTLALEHLIFRLRPVFGRDRMSGGSR